MFMQEIRERFYCDIRMKNRIPIMYQTECLLVLEDIIAEIKEENSYATISELFDE